MSYVYDHTPCRAPSCRCDSPCDMYAGHGIEDEDRYDPEDGPLGTMFWYDSIHEKDTVIVEVSVLPYTDDDDLPRAA